MLAGNSVQTLCKLCANSVQGLNLDNFLNKDVLYYSRHLVLVRKVTTGCIELSFVTG